jgi:hypothetical protein
MLPNDASKLVPWRVCHRVAGGRKVLYDDSMRGTHSIYHFLPWPYAKAIFRNRRLRLSPVHSWSDPYEKWWCQLLFNHPGKLSGVNAYGLCWTTSQYDEPAWRMAGYGRKEPIVRIRCCVETILAAGRSLIENKPGSLFLGTVHYARQKKLFNLAQGVVTSAHKEISLTASALLLQKRNAFRFAPCVRVVVAGFYHEPFSRNRERHDEAVLARF